MLLSAASSRNFYSNRESTPPPEMSARVMEIMLPISHHQNGILVFLRPRDLVMLWRASPTTAGNLAWWGVRRIGPFRRCRSVAFCLPFPPLSYCWGFNVWCVCAGRVTWCMEDSK
jgi:hypothetical protein